MKIETVTKIKRIKNFEISNHLNFNKISCFFIKDKKTKKIIRGQRDSEEQ